MMSGDKKSEQMPHTPQMSVESPNSAKFKSPVQH